MPDGASTMKTQIRPVKYHTKADAVYEQLRELIVDGTLAPLTPINQEQLAASLGVSTTPLREALRRLEAENLVMTAAHRQLVVCELDLETLPQLFRVKEQLDCLAAELAAENATEEDYDALDAALNVRPPRKPTLRSEWEANKTLHTVILLASHNPVLIEEQQRIYERYDRFFQFFSEVVFFDDTAREEHGRVVDAIINGRPPEAGAAMRAHHLRGRETLAKLVISRSESTPLAPS